MLKQTIGDRERDMLLWYKTKKGQNINKTNRKKEMRQLTYKQLKIPVPQYDLKPPAQEETYKSIFM